MNEKQCGSGKGQGQSPGKEASLDGWMNAAAFGSCVHPKTSEL